MKSTTHIGTHRIQHLAFSAILGCAATFGNAGPGNAAEKPVLTRLNPSGVQVDAKTAILATGTFKDWPVQVWCSVPGVEWKCGEKAGEFEVQVPANLPQSIGWVRFYNDGGFSSAKPFMIVSEKVVLEKDPNEKPDQVTDLLPADSIAFGSIDRTADADHFRIELKKGEPFYAIVDSARSLSSPLDAHLQLVNIHGQVLTENLDRYGYDPAIEYTPKEDGHYFLRVFGFPIEPNSTIAFQGSGDWCYSLRWNVGPRPWVVHSSNTFQSFSAPTDKQYGLSKADAKDIPLGTSIIQSIEQARESHFFKLPKRPNGFFKFTVAAQSMGSPLDPTIAILDGADKQVSQVDDVSTNRDPEMVWQMPAEGEYWVRISDFHKQGGPLHTYFLKAVEQQPSLAAKTNADSHQAKANTEFEIPLTLQRVANWTGNCEFLLEGLPDGSEITNGKLEVTEKTTAPYTLKVKVPTAWQGPLKLSMKLSHLETPVPVLTTKDYVSWLHITP